MSEIAQLKKQAKAMKKLSCPTCGTEVSIYALNENANLEKVTEGMQRSMKKQ